MRLSSVSKISITVQSAVMISFAGDTLPPTPQAAPISPEFLQWQSESTTVQRSVGGKTGGLIPSPTDNTEFLRQHPVKKKSRASLPTQFDLRTNGFVTSVKDQGYAGNCWAFTTMAALEGRAIIENFGTYDLSEKNLRNRSRFDRDLPNGSLSNDGGNADKSRAYLTRWEGPVRESDDPYDTIQAVSSHFPAAFTVRESRTYSDVASIKQALMDVGPLYTSYYNDNYYYSASSPTTYYMPGGPFTTNHAVTLCGWDDNMVVPGAPANGAWLIKNSWGDWWGDNGYFWLSYSDQSAVLTATSFCNFTPVNDKESLYYYDTLGQTNSFGYNLESGYGAIAIELRDNEKIKAVGTTMMANNSTAEVSIYSQKSPSLIWNDYVTFSNPLATVTVAFTEAGYYTIPLPTPVSGLAGDSLFVVVKYTCPGATYPIPSEMPIANYSSEAKSNPGESFVSNDGVNFTDVNQYGVSIAMKVITEKEDQTAVTMSGTAKSHVELTRSENKLALKLDHPMEIGYTIANLRGQILTQVTAQRLSEGSHALKMPEVPGTYVVQIVADGVKQNFTHSIR